MASGKLAKTNPLKGKGKTYPSPYSAQGRRDNTTDALKKEWDSLSQARASARTVAPFKVGNGPVRRSPRTPTYPGSNNEIFGSWKGYAQSTKKKKSK